MNKERIMSEINETNWKSIFKCFEYDDPETIEFFRESEEELLNKMFNFSEGTSLTEKRKKYARQF